MKTRVANKKVGGGRDRGRAFILRYLLSLLFGWAFAVVMIATISFVIQGIFGDKHNSLYFPNESFALMLTSLVVFGTLHLLLAFTVDGKVRLDERAEKVTKILSTVYNIGLVGMAAGFAIVALYPLIGCLTSLTNMEAGAVTQLVTTGTVAVGLLMVMMLHQARIPAKMPRGVYLVVMGTLAIVAMVLFLAIPMRESREAIKDQRIIDDLELIQSEIWRYVEKNDQLPENLNALGLGGLNRSLRDFEFRPGEMKSSAYYDDVHYFEYTLCADGFLRDMSGGNTQYGTFGNHTKGYNCFDLEAYGGYRNSGGDDYDYDYEYYGT